MINKKRLLRLLGENPYKMIGRIAFLMFIILGAVGLYIFRPPGALNITPTTSIPTPSAETPETSNSLYKIEFSEEIGIARTGQHRIYEIARPQKFSILVKAFDEKSNDIAFKNLECQWFVDYQGLDRPKPIGDTCRLTYQYPGEAYIRVIARVSGKKNSQTIQTATSLFHIVSSTTQP